MKKGIGYYFKVIGKEFENSKNKLLAKYDLTSQQFSIMMYLNRNSDKEINQKIIENEFNLSGPTISGILSRLESKGFIERVKSKIDSRNKIISPTKKLLEFREDIHEKIKENEKELLNDFSENEKEEFVCYLKRIITNIYGEEK